MLKMQLLLLPVIVSTLALLCVVHAAIIPDDSIAVDYKLVKEKVDEDYYDVSEDADGTTETLPLPTTTEYLQDDSFIYNIDDIDRDKTEEVLSGDEDIKSAYLRSIEMVNEEFLRVKAGLKLPGDEAKLKQLNEERVKKLKENDQWRDNVIQAGINDDNVWLTEYLNEIKEKYTPDKLMPLANAYLRVYLLEMLDMEHRVEEYTSYKRKYGIDDATSEQLNKTHDHLKYIQNVMEKIRSEIKSNKALEGILAPKIDAMIYRHENSRKHAREIIHEYTSVYNAKHEEKDHSLLLTIVFTSISSALITLVILTIVVLSVAPVRFKIVRYINKAVESKTKVDAKKPIFKGDKKQEAAKEFLVATENENVYGETTVAVNDRKGYQALDMNEESAAYEL